MKIKLGLLVLLIFLARIHLISQELPPVQNYQIIDYEAGRQNWSVTQSTDGKLFFGNNIGLLEFNGGVWQLYPSPNGTIVRAVHEKDGLIYSGCYMEFGYWKRNEFGGLAYHSLTDELSIDLKEDEHFWNITSRDEWILFQSLDRIYLFNSRDQQIKVIELITPRAKIFNLSENIYFQKGSGGLYSIKNGKAVLESDNSLFTTDFIVGLFEHQDGMLILTESGNFFLWEGDEIKSWKTDDLALDRNSFIYCSTKLQDGSFVLGTVSEGYIRLDDQGKIIERVNQEMGLGNNTVLSVFEDLDKNLWLGLDNGISVVNLESAFRIFADNKGKIGSVYASLDKGNWLYLGTNQGLYARKKDETNGFELIDGTAGQVWSLNEIEGSVFCGHNNGTFLINGDKATQVYDQSGTWEIKNIEGIDNVLIQGNYNGLSTLIKRNDDWIFNNKIEGFDISSKSFDFYDDNSVVVNHEFKGLFVLELSKDLSRVKSSVSVESVGFDSHVFRFQDKVKYASNEGVFDIERDESRLVKDSLLTRLFYERNDRVYGRLIPEMTKDRLWGFSSQNIVYLAQDKFDGIPELNEISIPRFFRQNQGLTGYENISRTISGKYIIGTSNGYAQLDLDRPQELEYTIQIDRIQKKFRNRDKYDVSLVEKGVFKFDENSLMVSFSIPSYNKYTEVSYQYQLIGLYEAWSPWVEESTISLENLPYGDYTLNIRGKVGNRLTSNMITYSFRVEKPWYLSNFAVIIYVLFVGLIMFIVNRLFVRYYRSQRNRLIEENKKKMEISKMESRQEIMKLKNDQLKNELESKNRELATTAMSLINKNELLLGIKQDLMQLDDKASRDEVIKVVDSNLSNNNDWEFFKEAFNNADKDFLNKMKKKHPELTANDLKFCAFLRLNLSSKEIAPLLNISVRSVEIKRYRLRKKMRLDHSENLIDYILEI
ncbi:two component regulator three y domain-containing protein [Lutimonas saemankumensis]|uniref:helix-turn-helix and ligand-binding sensor domain-containing protein n=1 Tax=Lutimonas saemankumensis TaxID=483016 RepID=UPI001CD5779F|nr:two component regulator three y domain-containing protein [Lutimonas saemankumensis]MCA0933863.1 two component regulator three y domain-containing protein [Lutimonas saemankumensis]